VTAQPNAIVTAHCHGKLGRVAGVTVVTPKVWVSIVKYVRLSTTGPVERPTLNRRPSLLSRSVLRSPSVSSRLQGMPMQCARPATVSRACTNG